MKETENLQVNLRKAREIVRSFLISKVPVMMWGPPGVGKSDLMNSFSEEFGNVIDLRLGQMMSTDVLGLPAPDFSKGTFKYLPLDMLPTKGKGIIFFDEINQASREVQVAALQLILDRRCGDYKIPDGYAITAGGNRENDNAFVNPLSSAVKNRMGHIEIHPDLDIWIEDFARPNNIDNSIIDFLKFRTELLYKMESGSHAFPSPRTWAMADKIVKANGTRKVRDSVGCVVSPAVAKEYQQFLDIYMNTDLEGIAKGDKKAIPNFDAKENSDASFKYAVTLGVATYVAQHPKQKFNLDPFGKAINREFKMVFLQSVLSEKNGTEIIVDLTYDSDIWGEYTEKVMKETMLGDE